MSKLGLRLWLLVGGVAMVLAIFLNDPYQISLVNLVAVSVLIVASLRFVMLIGEVSFATAAFVGFGAYGAGIATTLLNWPFIVALFVGALVTVAASSAFGAITLRSKGPFFMVIGLAFTEAVRILYSKFDIIGGTSGIVRIFPPDAIAKWMPAFVVGIVLCLLLVLYIAERSDFGKVLRAIRDNEDVVRTAGINVLFCKISCFALASFCAGMAGSLQAFVNNVISPADFNYHLAAIALACVKVGGEDSFLGSIFGAILLTLLGSYALEFGQAESLFFGAAIIVSMLTMPKGIAGLLSKKQRAWGPGRLSPLLQKSNPRKI